MKNTQRVGLGLLAVAALMTSACSNRNFALGGASATFQQAPTFNNKVDLLFIVDDSVAMNGYRQGMAAQAQNIINRLNSMGMDYHIAVTATSVGAGYLGGKFVGNTYMTRGTPNVASVLASSFSFSAPGSDLEQGLMSMTGALSSQNLALSGGGFLRSDALLAVVAVSPDEDYSSGATSTYTTFLNNLKRPFPSGAPSWVFNYVGSQSLQSTCSAFVNVGSRYKQMVGINAGISEDICKTDWSVAITDIQVVINQIMTNYYLATQPNPATIVVTLNGQRVPNDATNGWTLQNNGTQYYIAFHGSFTPTLYSTVNVSFTPANAN